MRPQLKWMLALVLSSLGAGAYAQETTTGSLAGEVVDNQGAIVPGATVTITSPQGARTLVTDASGRYFAPYLTPGSYAIRVELAGFSPVEQKGIQVRLGQRLEVNFSLKLGGIEDSIEVVAASPVVDTSSTTAGAVLDSQALGKLPVGRNFTETLYLVPGVSDAGTVGGMDKGRANPSISGASGLENNYVVDGVNVTDSGFGGVGIYNPIYGSLGVGVTTDFIKETQIKTAGFEAEYGQASGGVVSLVTQSGTNALHGSLFGYFRPSALEASYDQLQTVQGTVNDTGHQSYDFGASIGGPVVKDKLFFFGAFNPQYDTATRIAPDGFPLRGLGEVDRTRKTYAYAGKVTFQASSNHRFDLAAFGDPSKGDPGPQRPQALRRITSEPDSGNSSLDFGTNSQSLRYDGIISPNWLLEVSVARSANRFDETSAVDEWQITDLTVTPTAAFGGLGAYINTEGSNHQLSVKSTNIFHGAGQHQFRYGGTFEDVRFTRAQEYSGPGITLADGQQTSTGVLVQVRPVGDGTVFYRATRGNITRPGETTQKYLDFFAQDTWQVGKRLTVRPGIRWERQRLIGPTPGNGYPTLCHEGDSLPGAGDGSGPGIPCEYTWSNNWAPRVGATFDVAGNGKSKLYASYGRFFVKIPNDLASRALGADASLSRADYYDAGLTQPIPNGVSFAGTTAHLQLAGVGAAVIDPENAKSTYTNELLGGFEYDMGHGVNVGVRYIHRTIPRILEDWGNFPVVAADFGCPGASVVSYFIANISSSLPVAACNLPGSDAALISSAKFEDPNHKYQSLELTASKTSAGRWGLFASYRYAKLTGNFEGFYRNDNGQSDPSISSLFDFPTNDPSYTQVGGPQFGYVGDIRFQGTTLGEGRLPNDRPHQAKLYGNYAFGSLNLGAGFNVGSGKPLTALAANPNYANAGEIPLTSRGGGMQTADGFRERAPMDLQLDLHADYSFRFSDSQRLVLLADAFNLFNRQQTFDYDNWTEIALTTPNPNFGQPTYGGNSAVSAFQQPFALRLGARFEW